MKSSTFARHSAAFILLLSCLSLLSAQTYVLRSSVLADATTSMFSVNYGARLTLGQSFASGWLSGTAYRAVIGFWHGPIRSSNVSESADLRPHFGLAPCSPNPFSGTTVVCYALGASGHVRLSVFDRNGRVAGILVDAQQTPESYHVTWNIAGVPASRLPNGVYFLVLESGGLRATGKVVVNR